MTKPLNHGNEFVKLCADQLRAPDSSPYLSLPLRSMADVKRTKRDLEANTRFANVIPFPRGWQYANTSVEDHGKGEF